VGTEFEEILYPLDGAERDILRYLSRARDPRGTYVGAFAVQMDPGGESREDALRIAARVLDDLARDGLVELSGEPPVDGYLYPRWSITPKGRRVARMSE
jgi:hypothetical protein